MDNWYISDQNDSNINSKELNAARKWSTGSYSPTGTITIEEVTSLGMILKRSSCLRMQQWKCTLVAEYTNGYYQFIFKTKIETQ